MNRRRFIQGMGAAAALAATAGARRTFAGGAGNRKVVLLLYIPGGLHSRFLCAAQAAASPLAFQKMGAAAADVQTLGGGVAVDKNTFGTLNATSLSQFAIAGIRTGGNDHGTWQREMGGITRSGPTDSFARRLAAAMIGPTYNPALHTNACALIGVDEQLGFNEAVSILRDLPANATKRDLRIQKFSTVESLETTVPPVNQAAIDARTRAAVNLEVSRGYGALSLTTGPLGSNLTAAYDGAITSLQPGTAMPAAMTFDAIAANYGETRISNGTNRAAATSGDMTDLATKMAGAEFVLRNLGTQVAVVIDASVERPAQFGTRYTGAYDQHQPFTDQRGIFIYEGLARRIIPALNRFTLNMRAANIDATVVIATEFTRSLEQSDTGTDISGHGGCAIAGLIGPAFKNATTANLNLTSSNVLLTNPGSYALGWSPVFSVVARAAGVSAANDPFRPSAGNDHSSLLV